MLTILLVEKSVRTIARAHMTIPAIVTVTASGFLLFNSVSATAHPSAQRPFEQFPAILSLAATAESETIAITPFSNISGSLEDEWIGAGIVETLTANFSLLPTAAALGAETEPAARWIISGAYQLLNDHIRVTARSKM